MLSASEKKAIEEKRQHTRIPFNRPITVYVNDKQDSGTMTDFSISGVGFVCHTPLKERDRIEVHFEIPEDEKHYHDFQFKGEVRHCIDLFPDKHVGIKLETPSHEYIELFDKLASA
jgi:hypothetical protein